MALITAAQAREYIPRLTDTGSDTEIEGLITKADAVIAHWLGYPPATAGGNPTIEDTAYTDYFDGHDHDGRTLRLPVYPLVSITSVHDDPDRDYTAADLVASSDYTTDDRRGWVILNPDSTHGAWSKGFRSIKVVWTAGYATIPAALQHATAVLVAHWWRLRKERGQTNVSQGQGSAGLRPEVIPDEVRQYLAPYRLRGVLGG